MENNNFYKGYYEDHCFAHHGILGQKWGIRRYQNPDGTLTIAGKKRYASSTAEDIGNAEGLEKRLNDYDRAIARNRRSEKEADRKLKRYDKSLDRLSKKEQTDFTKNRINRINKKKESATGKKRTAENYIKEGEAEISRLKNRVLSSKYEFYERPTRRLTSKGYEIIAGLSALAASTVIAPVALSAESLGLTALGAASAVSSPIIGVHTQRGNEYRVKR